MPGGRTNRPRATGAIRVEFARICKGVLPWFRLRAVPRAGRHGECAGGMRRGNAPGERAGDGSFAVTFS